MTLVGLEPTISGSVDRCLIHWATGPDGVQQSPAYHNEMLTHSEGMKISSAAGTRTRVARVRAEYPNQLDYSGLMMIGMHT